MENNLVNGALFEIPSNAKREYLDALIGKMYKILHLFSERSITGFSPKQFIGGQLFELNAANSLFHGKLVTILIKVKGIYDGVDELSEQQVKKQIFEIQRMIQALKKELEG